MWARAIIAGLLCLLLFLGFVIDWQRRPPPEEHKITATVALPPPETADGPSLTETLARRRSVRDFTKQSLDLKQIGQLCWAAQGITDSLKKHRTAPSAGALYPLRVYVAIPDGFYRYAPDRHVLELVEASDVRAAIAQAARQRWLDSAGAIFAICGNISITAAKYHHRATRYVWQETGHVAQNLLLQATAMQLGATPVGAWSDVDLKNLLRLPKGWQPMYLLPVGVPEKGVRPKKD